jgi:hypothetical protein
MYCPKCKQTFEKGSRRFCPTDGARLIVDGLPKEQNGIFAKLIPRMEGISDINTGARHATGTGTQEDKVEVMDKVATEQQDEIFFELDDEPVGTAMDEAAFSQAARTFGSLPPGERASMAARPSPRKVNPYEISDGGVNLEEERPDIFTGDFDVSNPESFVGRMVKSRYRVTDFLGGDEAGLAYLGQDKIADKKVLVRILLQEESDEIMASILAEERVALSHLSHPNVARLIDSGTFTNGIQFLVSTYFDGLSVRDILDIYGKFPAERAGRIVRQAAGALGQAHQQGILHRDVRPENLIIDTDGEVEQVMLVNFGASNGQPTEMNAVYKAPEILDGRIATAGSDIFSLAAVAYEMLTGKLPFGGGSTKEILRSQHSGSFLRASDVDDELPHSVDEVLEKAFSYNAADRYTKAREFGDAFYSAVTAARSGQTVRSKGAAVAAIKPIVMPKPVVTGKVETLEPAVKPVRSDEPAWKARSPEPPEVEDPRTRTAWIIGILILLAVIGAGWWYIVSHPAEPPVQGGGGAPANTDVSVNTISSSTEMPPLPRNIPQPANTNFFENSKSNLKGDLIANFVGFTLYYPKDWKSNGPQPAIGSGRGKFLDISRETADGRMLEQMLVSYYPSKGTYSEDAPNFPQLVKESNETLKKFLPGYQAVSEGEIKVNGGWHAYELKFQGGGTSPNGEKLTVWGRRIFIPAARPGTRNGFEITMLATSLSDDIKSVDDVGVKGELGPILYSFEPSQNF